MKALYLAVALVLTACASNHSPDVYDGNEANRLSSVTNAVILDVRPVTIKGEKGLGAGVGAGLGGLGGYMAGGNDELRIAGAAVGAIAGGVAGAFVQEKTGTEKAWEYIVKKDNGQIQTLIQTGENPLMVGQNVYIIRNAEKIRIIPAERTKQ